MISHEEDNMNFGGALLACIKKCKYKDVIFINYGCLFNRNVIKKISKCENNKIIVTKKSQRNNHITVGCNVDSDDNINHIFYGLGPYKYMDMGYLNPRCVFVKQPGHNFRLSSFFWAVNS